MTTLLIDRICANCGMKNIQHSTTDHCPDGLGKWADTTFREIPEPKTYTESEVANLIEQYHYEFGDKTGIGRRAEEFENYRGRPTIEEINKIAALAEINPAHIIYNTLYLSLNIA